MYVNLHSTVHIQKLILNWLRNFPLFMNHKSPLLRSQEPITGLYSDTVTSATVPVLIWHVQNCFVMWHVKMYRTLWVLVHSLISSLLRCSSCCGMSKEQFTSLFICLSVCLPVCLSLCHNSEARSPTIGTHCCTTVGLQITLMQTWLMVTIARLLYSSDLGSH
jgi:hypothetical protein